jgi:hypothetical protein
MRGWRGEGVGRWRDEGVRRWRDEGGGDKEMGWCRRGAASRREGRRWMGEWIEDEGRSMGRLIKPDLLRLIGCWFVRSSYGQIQAPKIAAAHRGQEAKIRQNLYQIEMISIAQ